MEGVVIFCYTLHILRYGEIGYLRESYIFASASSILARTTFSVEKIMNTYKERDIQLAELGYDSYSDYLKSKTWKDIRHTLLNIFPKCEFCGINDSRQVHHISYDRATLIGKQYETIFATCYDCHHEIEFDCDGKKRTFDQTIKKTKSKIPTYYMSDRDKLINPSRHRKVQHFDRFGKAFPKSYDPNNPRTWPDASGRWPKKKDNDRAKKKRKERKRKERKLLFDEDGYKLN